MQNNFLEEGILYLFPTPIGESPLESTILQGNIDILKTLDYMIVENPKTARAFLKYCGIPSPYKQEFFTLDKRTSRNEITEFLEIAKGKSIGLFSEAGAPGVADPGANVVSICHKMGKRVIPLVGPSSILMALMASGLNGQNFFFKGYLPIGNTEKIREIKSLEAFSSNNNTSIIFIETPFRSQIILHDLLKNLSGGTFLAVSANIMAPNEFIYSGPINAWKRREALDLKNSPAIYIFQAGKRDVKEKKNLEFKAELEKQKALEREQNRDEGFDD